MARRDRFPDEVYNRKEVIAAEENAKKGILTSTGRTDESKIGLPLEDESGAPKHISTLSDEELLSLKRSYSSMASIPYNTIYFKSMWKSQGYKLATKNYKISFFIAAALTLVTAPGAYLARQIPIETLSTVGQNISAAAAITALSGCAGLAISLLGYGVSKVASMKSRHKAEESLENYYPPLAIANENANLCHKEIGKRYVRRNKVDKPELAA